MDYNNEEDRKLLFPSESYLLFLLLNLSLNLFPSRRRCRLSPLISKKVRSQTLTIFDPIHRFFLAVWLLRKFREMRKENWWIVILHEKSSPQLGQLGWFILFYFFKFLFQFLINWSQQPNTALRPSPHDSVAFWG